MKLASELKVGDKIPGGRLSNYYAIIEEIREDYVLLHYNGECRSIHVSFDELERLL